MSGAIITIIGLLSAAITIYTILCFIDILLSWFPGAKFTGFGKFISRICDPYLHIFSKKGIFRIGNIDFSPILAIGILSLASSILGGIISNGFISIRSILVAVIRMIQSLSNSLLSIVFLLVLIRWIVLKANKGRIDYNSGWYQIDTILQKFCYKVSYTFIKKNVSYEKSLLTNWIVFLILIAISNILFKILETLCLMLPL